MAAIILDTDIFIEILRNTPAARTWLAVQSPRPLLGGVAALEATFGSQLTAELHRVQNTISHFQVVWPTEADFRLAISTLSRYKLSNGIGGLDALAAAAAVNQGLSLASFNAKHFIAVPGLSLVVPYLR